MAGGMAVDPEPRHLPIRRRSRRHRRGATILRAEFLQPVGQHVRLSVCQFRRAQPVLSRLAVSGRPPLPRRVARRRDRAALPCSPSTWATAPHCRCWKIRSSSLFIGAAAGMLWQLRQMARAGLWSDPCTAAPACGSAAAVLPATPSPTAGEGRDDEPARESRTTSPCCACCSR